MFTVPSYRSLTRLAGLTFAVDPGVGAGGGASGAPASGAAAGANPPMSTTTGAAAGAAAPQGSGAAAPSPSDWMAGLPDEDRGYLQTKGIKDSATLTKAYRGLESLMGVPKEQLLKLPADEKAPEWEQVYNRLGKPEKPDGYKIEAVQGESADFVEWAKSTFHGANLTAKQAETVIAKWNELQNTRAEAAKTAHAAKVKAAGDELKSAWGNAYDQNLTVARTAAKEFGITEEVLAALDNTMGTKRTMEFLHSIGSKIGEAKFTQGDGRSGGFGKMSPEQALAQVAAYRADPEFMAKYMTKSAREYKLFSDALRDAYPGEMTI